MSARFSLKITTRCHSVRSRASPDWRSFQRSLVATARCTIFWLFWVWRTSGSRPRLPTRITLLTLPAIGPVRFLLERDHHLTLPVLHSSHRASPDLWESGLPSVLRVEVGHIEELSERADHAARSEISRLHCCC